jgi:hypothetical protein
MHYFYLYMLVTAFMITGDYVEDNTFGKKFVCFSYYRP